MSLDSLCLIRLCESDLFIQEGIEMSFFINDSGLFAS